ncbi:C4-dicarboxylate TRAP transporter substrate-binding protein [Pseudooceanicola sp.]|uniref:C4-dicarboxylate TRAP transporter substrate-binding protein n=1 Tax=Pseudooceanicola sp. TaxID=1914328 RepID=UPI0035C76712
MTKLTTTGLAGAFVLASGLPALAETYSFTIVAGHPPITGGVAELNEVFIPEVNKRLEAMGHSVNWTEAYAGSVADFQGVLEAVESGIAEFGYVPHLFEGDKLPLEQITYVTPFGTSDLSVLMDVIGKLHDEIPEMDEAWAENGQKVLAPVGIDSYHFVTNFEINSMADLENRKIGTAGLALNWLKDTGAIPVAGALPTFYNSMSTGLYDGVMTFESAITPYKFFEVAPNITKIDFGAQYASALTVNLDIWNDLPEDVQAAIQEAADLYRESTAQYYQDAGANSLAKAAESGATIKEVSPEFRAEYAAALPSFATEWAKKLDAEGKPGTKTLETYMRLSREAGVEHARKWGDM